MRIHRAIFAFAALLPLFAADPVRIETGQVAGVPGTNPEVQVFKGIPFAAPPVGDLRWKGPKPAAKWEGVRTADKFGNACIQRGAGTAKGNDRATGEDCLYLNVYTAAKSNEKRPVMVWIHGGALTSGSGSIYNGEALAKKGVVVVTVNYRLGVFGYFAHPELTKESDHNGSGNYGLQDQVAALQWVQKNIAAFGGDPKNVTIFGESAGSWSVNMLVATPLAKGLFHRAIGESGAEFANIRKLDDAEKLGAKFAQSAGAESLAALRAKSAEEVQKAGGYSGPNVDNWALPEDVYTIFAKGKQNDVPTLIGSNADEGTMFAPATITAAVFRETVQRRYGADALKLYPAENDEQAAVAMADTIRDSVFGWEMRTWARMQNKTGKSKVYLYYFSRIPPGPDAARRRSYHSAEIAYVFHNVATDTRRQWEDTDRKLSDVMSSYWVNFATTGDPNGGGLLKWPVYDQKSDTVMGFGDKVELIPLPHKAQLDFLDTHFEKRRKTGEGPER
jgi:para-nitrobenzyl esterase